MVIPTRWSRQNNPTFVLRISPNRIDRSDPNRFFSDPLSDERRKCESVVGRFRVEVVGDAKNFETFRRPANAQVHLAVRIRQQRIGKFEFLFKKKY